ncbi:MAG TPA: hypothetical protein PKL54_10320 [Candidatus Hydrogenedentes bacterium]|nr:hypothetical protein [Candidatus Hydrogenedentota bacterium]HOC73201.1 hypothetical protein [Candidatus Hydrogenedentota bacterium]
MPLVRFALTALTVIQAAAAVSAADEGALRVSVRKDSTAGGLNVEHPGLPGNVLAYLSCEGVVFGYNRESTPLFEVKVSGDPTAEEPRWDLSDGVFSYSFTYDQGIRVNFRAVPQGERLKLRYTLTNVSEKPLERVLLHTCVPTTEAPAFFPGFVESPVHEPEKTGNYMGFYDRTFLWSGERAFTVGGTEKGREEIHLSFTRTGQRPVEWGWWNNGPEGFDLPLIALASADGKHTAALGFDRADWASCNGGDDRACFHLFPLFGDLQPGQSATVEGCFYVMRGSPEEVRKRFVRDFPGVGAGTPTKQTVNKNTGSDR